MNLFPTLYMQAQYTLRQQNCIHSILGSWQLHIGKMTASANTLGWRYYNAT